MLGFSAWYSKIWHLGLLNIVSQKSEKTAEAGKSPQPSVQKQVIKPSVRGALLLPIRKEASLSLKTKEYPEES